jgi:ribosomal protein S18 acetylase RimI-like enzyme
VTDPSDVPSSAGVPGPGEGAPSSTGVLVERVTTPTEADAAAIARLVPQLSSTTPPDHEALSAIASAPGTALLLARSGGDVVGMLTLVTFRIPTGLRAIVEDVVVDGSARGLGVGSALVDEAVRLARAAGARNVDLTSRPSREAANRLYERSGFARRATNVWRYEMT